MTPGKGTHVNKGGVEVVGGNQLLGILAEVGQELGLLPYKAVGEDSVQGRVLVLHPTGLRFRRKAKGRECSSDGEANMETRGQS